ncbi:unnamed protein product [Prorocentrum cordatum]|uniref:Protein-serine/threonine kinase n=1 Tax=Prorocentrum cordatum TaxID=2364126 RepID=A0ABN9U173_9DINO|nr:unnamed protein product [Polarella glacialis]
MLIAQYLEMIGGSKTSSLDSVELPCSGGRDGDDLDPYQASINPRCHPYFIAKHAAVVIGKLCKEWYGYAPEIRVMDAGAEPFPFVPRYLFYILSELLKNSVRATVECNAGRDGGAGEQPRYLEPVSVVVCGGEGTASIRVSDEGGGIPVDALNHVWSYLYTTAEPIEVPYTRDAVDAPTDLRRLETGSIPAAASAGNGWGSLAEPDHEDHSLLLRSPLAGLGCGLPLTRLYAEYLGGEVKLHTLPRFGTDVFVYLSRLEHLPSDRPLARLSTLQDPGER